LQVFNQLLGNILISFSGCHSPQLFKLYQFPKQQFEYYFKCTRQLWEVESSASYFRTWITSCLEWNNVVLIFRGMKKNVKWVKLPPFNCDTQHPDRWKDYVQFLSCCYLFFPELTLKSLLFIAEYL
jgi:hypothetical protein